MRRAVLMVVAFFAVVLTALSLPSCQVWDPDYGHLGAETAAPPDDPLPGEPAYCNGVCVATPPATYTGPSLFWIGRPDVAEGCPDETPDKGIEGYVPGQIPLIFARECRVTPSDLCAEEGQTCAPLPRPEFHLCIHRLGATDCPPEYQEHTDLSEVGTKTSVTLCCQKSPLPS